MEVAIGLDIGQKRDPTALCVAEIHERQVDQERQEVHFRVRHLERMPLGTPYPQVAGRMGEVFGKLKSRSGSSPRLYADATGVGQPIVDLLEEKGVPTVACYFNHGDQRSDKEWNKVTIGKAFLVSRLQALLQSHRLHLPKDHSEASALGAELLNYEIRIDENANDKYGAFKVGTHDDLVTALGLAVQVDRPVGKGYALRLR